MRCVWGTGTRGPVSFCWRWRSSRNQPSSHMTFQPWFYVNSELWPASGIYPHCCSGPVYPIQNRTGNKRLKSRTLNDESDGESLPEDQTNQSSESCEPPSYLTRTPRTRPKSAVILANISKLRAPTSNLCRMCYYPKWAQQMLVLRKPVSSRWCNRHCQLRSGSGGASRLQPLMLEGSSGELTRGGWSTERSAVCM